MIMTREEMMDKVINALGFEDERTVTFCRLAESTMTDDELLAVLKVLLEDQKGVAYEETVSGHFNLFHRSV